MLTKVCQIIQKKNHFSANSQNLHKTNKTKTNNRIRILDSVPIVLLFPDWPQLSYNQRKYIQEMYRRDIDIHCDLQVLTPDIASRDIETRQNIRYQAKHHSANIITSTTQGNKLYEQSCPRLKKITPLPFTVAGFYFYFYFYFLFFIFIFFIFYFLFFIFYFLFFIFYFYFFSFFVFRFVFCFRKFAIQAKLPWQFLKIKNQRSMCCLYVEKRLWLHSLQ